MRKKRYADAFKKQLIALVAQGRTPEQLAREYEPTAQTIRNWVNEAQKQQPASELEKDRLIKEQKQRTRGFERSVRSWEKRRPGSRWRAHQPARRVQIRERAPGRTYC